MSFVGKVWKLLVGIKDGLVLLFMLLFFMALFAILSARPSPGQVREGALLIELDGFVVEERSEIDPFQAFVSGQAPVTEFQARDLVTALNAAATDDRIKAVVLDLSSFLGGGQVHLQAVGDAMARVRAADKPVLTYALAYGDDHMHLASHASEVWVDPLGGAIIAGPGGSNLYFADLLERFNVNARIYRVGEFKSGVEPYSRNSMSPEARENAQAFIGALWEEWQANVKKARPAIDIDRVTGESTEWINATDGDLAQAALDAGLVDKLGNRVEFGERVAELAGEARLDKTPGAYATTDFKPLLADSAPDTSGKAIGVVTVAGVIVDGDAGPGSAGGDRIAETLNKALDDDLAGLVVRVDSPGGSVTASEEIRRAIERYRAKDIPVAISFANVAASGGYWVATAGDRIFAQPETITGSIGVFAVLPTFEETAAEFGVNADGVRTTPLSGQPDIIGGFTPEIDELFQATISNTYTDFLDRVSKSRGMSNDQVDQIAQGRVWDGGTARQLKLVDQFGGMEEALAWVAEQAELEEDGYHARYLGGGVNQYDSLIRQMLRDSEANGTARGADLFALAAQQRNQALGQLAKDFERLSGTQGVQAYCLECPKQKNAASHRDGSRVLSFFRTLLTQ